TNLGIGINHPRIKSLDAVMTTYSKTLADQLNTIRQTQANRVRLEKDRLSALEAQAKDTREQEAAEKAKMVEYIEAKNKYIQARKLLEAVELSYTQQKMNQSVTPPTAKIWEPAEPAQGPVNKVPWYMGLAALVGLVLGVSLAFFIEYLDTSVK